MQHEGDLYRLPLLPSCCIVDYEFGHHIYNVIIKIQCLLYPRQYWLTLQRDLLIGNVLLLSAHSLSVDPVGGSTNIGRTIVSY